MRKKISRWVGMVGWAWLVGSAQLAGRLIFFLLLYYILNYI
jgi:hypothetical protein